MLTTDSALQQGSGLSKASHYQDAFLSAFPQEKFTFYRPETRDLVGLSMLPKVSLNKMLQNQDPRTLVPLFGNHISRLGAGGALLITLTLLAHSQWALQTQRGGNDETKQNKTETFVGV